MQASFFSDLISAVCVQLSGLLTSSRRRCRILWCGCTQTTRCRKRFITGLTLIPHKNTTEGRNLTKDMGLRNFGGTMFCYWNLQEVDVIMNIPDSPLRSFWGTCRAKKSEKWLCLCDINFSTFLYRPLQNNSVNWPNSSYLIQREPPRQIFRILIGNWTLSLNFQLKIVLGMI